MPYLYIGTVAGNPLNPANYNFPEYTSGLARLRREFLPSPGPPDDIVTAI